MPGEVLHLKPGVNTVFKIVEIAAKSLIVSSKLPDADYVVNPYVGCQFGCLYCYASFMGRMVDEARDAWGSYVYVKTNSVEVFSRDLKKLARRHPSCPSLLLSSVTDPYQGIEKKYALTRGILEAVVHQRYRGTVSVLTKSPLVLRDIDLLSEIPTAEIGMTVTTQDDALARSLEVNAPAATARLRTLRALSDAGIHTYAFVGPLLPHYRDSPDLLDRLFGDVASAGVSSVYVEHLNLRRDILNRVSPVLGSATTEAASALRSHRISEYRAAIDRGIAEMLKQHGLELRLRQVIVHGTPAS